MRCVADGRTRVRRGVVGQTGRSRGDNRGGQVEFVHYYAGCIGIGGGV